MHERRRGNSILVGALVLAALLGARGLGAQTSGGGPQEKPDFSGRWTLDPEPRTLKEKSVATAEYRNVGVLIQGRDFEIEQTEREIRVRQGVKVFAVALEGTSRNRSDGSVEFETTATWEADRLILSTKIVGRNPKVQTAQQAVHELTVVDGRLMVKTTPPYITGMGTPPPDVMTATLSYEKQ